MSRYRVYIIPVAFKEIKTLPGNIRHRVRAAVDKLAKDPRPSQSKLLRVPGYELRRIRIEQWRILYAVSEDDKIIDVLGVRKRPPYDYGDLEELLAEIE